jgi:uncharacterized membrane protein
MDERRRTKDGVGIDEPPESYSLFGIRLFVHGDRLRMLRKTGRFLLLTHKDSASRYWEIDALRGVAIVMMVIYHFAYDLTLFGYYQADVFVGSWRVFARITASLFILLVGSSLALSRARTSHGANGWHLYRNYLGRGLKLVGWGMVITLVTWMYMGKVVIIFGILHLIGTAIILAYPFLSFGPANLAIGIAGIGAGIYLNRLPVTSPWLLPLGLRPPALYQLDYFPLLPWLGVVLLGVFAGQLLYPGGTQRFDLPRLDGQTGLKELTWLGRRSLIIYLLHQPILFTLFTLASVVGLGMGKGA